MTAHEETVNAVLSHNIAETLEHGPGLRYSTQTVILARDPKRNRVLVGGLGACGVGEMWFKEGEKDKDRPGYATCPVITGADSDWGVHSNWENGCKVCRSAIRSGYRGVPVEEFFRRLCDKGRVLYDAYYQEQAAAGKVWPKGE